MGESEPTGFLILKNFSRGLWCLRSRAIDPAGPTPSPRTSDPRLPSIPAPRARHPRPRAPIGHGTARHPRTQWVRVPGAICPGKVGEKPGHPVGQGFNRGGGGIPGNPGKNRGSGEKPGKKGTQWVRVSGFRGAGDKNPFSRAPEALFFILFEKHLFSGFPKMHP